jgi:hypothetical protein
MPKKLDYATHHITKALGIHTFRPTIPQPTTVAFGMGNTLLASIDKYYEDDGEWEIRDKGLTIGSYESAP